MKKSAITASLLLAMSLPFAAAANDGPPPFEDLDKDGNGELSLQELGPAPFANEFDQLDKDGSGGLSQEELPPPPQ